MISMNTAFLNIFLIPSMVFIELFINESKIDISYPFSINVKQV